MSVRKNSEKHNLFSVDGKAKNWEDHKIPNKIHRQCKIYG